jgi:hypothetical protein
VINILKLAYTYKDKLQAKYSEVVFQDKYKFYSCSVDWDYAIKISEDSWNNIQFVSVDEENNIRGYLSAHVSRNSDKVTGLGIINFYDTNIVFSKDLYQFLKDLFEKFNFRKIEFSVVIGNPIEKMYDKYIKKYGGRIVGISKDDTKLQDGKYYDLKYYEIFREDYLKSKS